MTPSVRQIEAALVELLEELDLGGTVTTYAGQVEAAMRGAEIDVPALLVGFGGMQIDPTLGHFAGKIARLNFFVVVIARSYEGGDSVRTAEGTGAYDLVDSVRAAVDGDKLGLDDLNFPGLTFESATLVLSQATQVAYRIAFSTLLEA